MAGGVGGQIALLEAAGNGDGTSIQIPKFGHLYESHLRTLYVYGTFDGATVRLQISPDNATWFDVSGADAITAAAAINVEFRAPYVRGTVSAGGASVAIEMRLL